ncbi:MAG: hypothetical protein ABI624_00290 [Casimicrobiaceae bacterium]
MAAGVTGKIKGVGNDIVEYMTEVAVHFDLTIVVTSGYRDAAGQAKAMFDNWIKLKRGVVYSKKALPEEDRKKLDAHYDIVKGTKADAKSRLASEAAFLKLAAEKVGTKSRHSHGRAVDVTKASVPANAYAAITRRMQEIREGGRNDIYHFESLGIIPKVTDADRKIWDVAKSAAVSPHRTFLMAGGDDLPCVCIG